MVRLESKLLGFLSQTSDRLANWTNRVHWSHTCGCISRSDLKVLSCLIRFEIQKKWIETSGRELRSFAQLVHPWEQFSDAWRARRSSVRTLICTYRHDGNVQRLYRSEIKMVMKELWSKMQTDSKTRPGIDAGWRWWVWLQFGEEEAITPRVT